MSSAAFHSLHLSFIFCITARANSWPPLASVWLWPVMYFTHSYRPA